MLVVLHLGIVNIYAQDENGKFCVDGIWYSIKNPAMTDFILEGATGKLLHVVSPPNTASSNTYKGDLEIPEEVLYEDTKYPVRIIESGAFENCTDLTSVSLPNSLYCIGGQAFQGCLSLKSVAIPNDVTFIGPEAFISCANMEEITLSDRLEFIGYWCFGNCSKLKVVKLPNSLTTLQGSAFERCIALEEVVIPDGVKVLEDHTFRYCENIRKITLSRNLEEIGIENFDCCKKDVAIYSPNPLPPVYHDIVYTAAPQMYPEDPVEPTATLYVPVGSKDAYSQADYWKEFSHIEEMSSPTDISTTEMRNVMGSSDVYNLQGVRVSDTSKKGVYIKNGKKHMILSNSK